MGRNDFYTIKVVCAKCRTELYKYKKEGGGELIKCYCSNILEDYTNGDLRCPKCGSQFARNGMVHGRPANIIIGGKVNVKGHHGKNNH